MAHIAIQISLVFLTCVVLITLMVVLCMWSIGLIHDSSDIRHAFKNGLRVGIAISFIGLMFFVAINSIGSILN